MTYTKIIRIKDKKVFYVLDNEYLCTDTYRMVKHLKDVRDFTVRFRYFIVGIDKWNQQTQT